MTARQYFRDFLLRRGYMLKAFEPRPMIKAVRDYFGNQRIKGCELGVWYGDHAQEILTVLNCELYLIDTYEPYADEKYSEDYTPEKLQRARKIAQRVKGTWVTREDLPEVDFMYIDANHSYKEVKKDIKFALSKVKHGIIGGHDYSLDYPGVVKAVNEKFKNVNHINNDWWVIV